MTASVRQVDEVQIPARRIEYIEGIRGVAALAVVVHHAVERVAPEYKAWAFEWLHMGRIGVVAFFVVSGYVVALMLVGRDQTPRAFAIRRFWRLYPIYWLTTILYVFTVIATGVAPLDYSIVVVLLNVTMIQGFIGVPSILPVAWTLGIELAYYAQTVVTKLARLLEKGVWLGFAWLAIFAGYAVYNFAEFGARDGSMPLMMFTASLGFAFFLWQEGRSRAFLPMLLAAVLVVPILGGMLKFHGNGDFEPFTPVGFGLSYLAGLALFGAFYLARSHQMYRWILRLGAISYALYLIHMTVLLALRGIQDIPILFITAGITLSVIAAGLLYRFVEKPSIAIGRQHTPR
jgi:peptidoglycan/LPS O-acetylase OafA/YrhL